MRDGSRLNGWQMAALIMSADCLGAKTHPDWHHREFPLDWPAAEVSALTQKEETCFETQVGSVYFFWLSGWPG